MQTALVSCYVEGCEIGFFPVALKFVDCYESFKLFNENWANVVMLWDGKFTYSAIPRNKQPVFMNELQCKGIQFALSFIFSGKRLLAKYM